MWILVDLSVSFGENNTTKPSIIITPLNFRLLKPLSNVERFPVM